jgi:putative transcriptional regulator
MIRIKFKQLLDDKGFRERRRINLAEVVESTGLSKATISRIANTPGYNANLDAVDALCKYFECDPGDLLDYVEG